MIKTNKIYEKFSWSEEEGLKRKQGEKFVFLSNFFPKVIEVYDTQEERRVIVGLIFMSGKKSQVTISIEAIDRIDWFKLDNQCIVDDDVKNVRRYLSQLVRVQIAEYQNSIDKNIVFTDLGWNCNAYGNSVYVGGNTIIGGNGKEKISSALADYKLDFYPERQEEMLKTFVELLGCAPSEARMLILYFFTGIIKSLYRQANVPVDFAFFVYGEQQNRKTTLARLTNNLYNRGTEMNFSVRTIEKHSPAMADKLISGFKDTTLILDDLSMTNDRQYRQKQERIVEYVVRMLGNNCRRSSNVGNNVKEYYPNANVIFTAEYLPCFPESTLSRMLIMEIKNPVNSGWLTELEKEPLMLSTVAYSFISWIQKDYNKYVNIIQKNFEQYREKGKENPTYQERIYEHEFIMTCTGSLLENFLTDNGFMGDARLINIQNTCVLRDLIERQIELMEETKLKNTEKDFCRIFVEFYMEHKHQIAEVGIDKEKPLMQDKHMIYITTSCMCKIIGELCKDNTITDRAITKQLKANGFLLTDNSKQAKSTKKRDHIRYLHIFKDAVKEYYKYYCH